MLPTVSPSDPGPILKYLKTLLSNPATRKHAIEARNAVRAILSSKEGAILLDLLNKSTFEQIVSAEESSSALVARNAQAFIAHDLRRIMSNELDALFEGHTGNEPRRKRNRNTGGR